MPILADEAAVSFDALPRTFTFNDQALSGLGSSTTSVVEPFSSTYTIKVQAVINAVTTPDTFEYSFTLTIYNPCVDNTLNWINIPAVDMEAKEFFVNSGV